MGNTSETAKPRTEKRLSFITRTASGSEEKYHKSTTMNWLPLTLTTDSFPTIAECTFMSDCQTNRVRCVRSAGCLSLRPEFSISISLSFSWLLPHTILPVWGQLFVGDGVEWKAFQIMGAGFSS